MCRKVINVKANLSKTDLYNSGYNYFRGGSFQQSADQFNLYAQKFPDDIFGYYMMGKSYWGIDTLMTQGLANPSFEKAVVVGEAYPDKSKIIAQLVGSYKYLIAYNANIKRDKAGAIALSDKALLIDSTDQELKGNKEAIKNMNMNAPPPKATQTSVGKNGEKITIDPDGTITTVAKDGTTTIVAKGKVTTIKNGITTIVENGKVTTIGKDGKIITSVPPKAPGQKPVPKKK